jgi:hemoglobin
VSTLYERLGGEAAIMAVVRPLYDKLIADELTRPFFSGLDLEELTRKQVAFLAWAFDGPWPWRGKDLRSAHASLLDRGLGDAHFDAVAHHLAETMFELDVDRATVTEVMEIVESLRNEVLGR